MPFIFENLDETTRQYMRQEFDLDVANNALYVDRRLNDEGMAHYATLLRTAIEGHDEVWLAEQLRPYLNSSEERRTTSGGTTIAKVPIGAHQTLAESEFNRFYIRGLCSRAIAEGIESVEVYRGKEVGQPRPTSQAKIGQQLAVLPLLHDLRTAPGMDSISGLAAPNSGLTVRLPRREEVVTTATPYDVGK